MAEQLKDQVSASDFNLINATPAYIAQLNEALAYLQQSPKAKASQLLNDMRDEGISIRFVGAANGAKYHPEASTEITPTPAHAGAMASIAKPTASYPARTIDWNPNAALSYTDAKHSGLLDLNGPIDGIDKDVKHLGVLSPALILMHEGGHALDPAFLKRLTQHSKQYDNKAEEYAAKEVEHKVAKESGESIRENHGGTWLAAGTISPTLHTVAYQPARENEQDEEILQWQHHHLAGAVVVTGGLFTQYSVHHKPEDQEAQNTIPDLGTYSVDNNTLKVDNVSIELNKLKQDLTIQGNGNTLDLSKQPLPEDISIITQGRFTIEDGETSKVINGTNRLSTNPAGDLVITAEKATQAVSNQQDYKQLAQTFNDTIKHPQGIVQQHTALSDSLTFYNAAATQLPAPVVKQIGNNLYNEIKAGRPLQLAANPSLNFNEEISQASVDDVEL